MKKALVLMCLIAACNCYAGEEGLTLQATVADGADTCLNLSVGWMNESRWDVGVMGRWFETNTKDLDPPAVIGAQVLYHFDEILDFNDVTVPDNPLEEILHGFHAQPYVGLAIVNYFAEGPDEGKTRLNVKSGFLIAPDTDFDISFVIDYTFGDWALTPDDDWAVTFGVFIKIK